MIFIRECDSLGNVVESQTNFEMCELWICCLNNSKQGNGRLEWRFVETQMLNDYGSVSSNSDDVSSDSGVDLVTSSPGLTRFLMLITISESTAFYNKVTGTSFIYNDKDWIKTFQVGLIIFNMGNKANIVIEPCLDGEKDCIRWPKGVDDKCFYFYAKVILNFGVNIHVAPVQFHHNSWAFCCSMCGSMYL